ncbi:MAG: TusE/DsrC/DsvC family sulfur relay protein [Bacillota bacterium]
MTDRGRAGGSRPGGEGAGGSLSGLSPEQRAVVDYAVAYYRLHGHTPNLRTLVNELGLDKKRVYLLFPGNPIRRICQITGLPMPPEC